MESSAVGQEAPGGVSFEGTDSLVSDNDNVSSIAAVRRARAVDDAVKAYFDALFMEDVPNELEQLVIGLR
ncbi:hypothetical protein D3C71_277760 [compost metagenome]